MYVTTPKFQCANFLHLVSYRLLMYVTTPKFSFNLVLDNIKL